MADNVVANAGAGGATFATDDDGTAHWPYAKLAWGANNTQTPTAAGAAALPIQDGGNSITVDGTVAVSGTVTVDASGAAVPVTDNGGSLTVDGTVAVTGVATAAKQDSQITLLAGGLPAALGAQGALKIEGVASGTAVPISVASIPSHAVTNAGTFAVQVDGSALTALQVIDNPVLVDDAAFTPATSSVMMAGFEADESSTDSVDEGDAAAARVTLDRKLIVNPQPHTAGGLSTARSLDLDETAEDIKTSPGQVYGWNITNFRTSTVYVKFYNATAANVTVGTTTPLFTLAIPGNASDDTMLSMMGAHGITFGTAISWAATTGLADNDTGAPAANDVAGTVWCK